MNILITPSPAITSWIKQHIEIDFTYKHLTPAIFKMMDKEDTNIFGMLSPATVADLRHAVYFHIQLNRPSSLIGKSLRSLYLSDVVKCNPELLEIRAETLDKWPI
jgi:hypothetical protein